MVSWYIWSDLSSTGFLQRSGRQVNACGVVAEILQVLSCNRDFISFLDLTKLTTEGSSLNWNASLYGEELLIICPRARIPLRMGTSMICHGSLGTTAGTNELEVLVGMRIVQWILLVEATRMYQGRRGLLASSVGRENSSVMGQNRAARHVRDWDIVALMMRFGGNPVPNEVM
jgi:hypothetical protein